MGAVQERARLLKKVQFHLVGETLQAWEQVIGFAIRACAGHMQIAARIKLAPLKPY